LRPPPLSDFPLVSIFPLGWRDFFLKLPHPLASEIPLFSSPLQLSSPTVYPSLLAYSDGKGFLKDGPFLFPSLFPSLKVIHVRMLLLSLRTKGQDGNLVDSKNILLSSSPLFFFELSFLWTPPNFVFLRKPLSYEYPGFLSLFTFF